jgi:hypothetical protein
MDLRELLDGASPGEWTAETRATCTCSNAERHGKVRANGRTVADCFVGGNAYGAADARLIAALRNEAPALLDLKDAVMEWHRALNDYNRGANTFDKQRVLDAARERLVTIADRLTTEEPKR